MNELGILLFIIGFVLGCIAFVIVGSLCVIAKRSDERAEQMLNRGKDNT